MFGNGNGNSNGNGKVRGNGNRDGNDVANFESADSRAPPRWSDTS